MRWGNDRGAIQLVPIIIVVGVIVIVYLVLIYFFGSKPGPVPVPEDVCKCQDLYEMESRVAQASAAINHIATMAMTQSQQPNGSSTMYTPAQYDQGKDATQGPVAAARRPGAGTGSATTDSNCKSKIDSPSKCIAAGLQAHENVHITECAAHMESGKEPADWKEAKTMIAYWREDIAAYQAEIDYLSRQINRIKADPDCKPKVSTYKGRESRQDQAQRLAAAQRRVTNYARIIG